MLAHVSVDSRGLDAWRREASEIAEGMAIQESPGMAHTRCIHVSKH